MTATQRYAAAAAAAVTIQVIAGLLWAGAAAQRLQTLEARLDRLSALEVQAARLEEQSTSLRTALARIEGKLDRVLTEEAQQ
ncbi:hypothetical protein [Parvularcula maris]|uniref:Uncharacterized protein n=1 Tax=Parvularcula maris TaxID=2965077 RepID=A0A9X2L6V6_9PROT|nr:hypothetical protein [Parvularcula maris]MCQ8184234.1 hypothetical protein [Parvularcula maris]